MAKYYASAVEDAVPNEPELLIKYPNGSRLQLFGADNPDSFRGAAFSGLSFDEYSQQPRNIFSEVLSKALADHLGYAIFAGTIKGKDHLFDSYQAAKSDPAWFAVWQDIDVSLARTVHPGEKDCPSTPPRTSSSFTTGFPTMTAPRQVECGLPHLR